MFATNFKKLNNNVICEVEVETNQYLVYMQHKTIGLEQVFGTYPTLEDAQAMLEMKKDDPLYEYYIVVEIK